MGPGTKPVLSEAEVQDMHALEPSRCNCLLLRLLYSTGLHPSELCALCWRDVQESRDAGQLVIVGKGGQLRFVFLRVPVWEDLSRLGGSLSPRQVDRLVRAAARRAHIKLPVSPRLVRYARPPA